MICGSVQLVEHFHDGNSVLGAMVFFGVEKTEDLLELLDGEVVFGDALDDGESETTVIDVVLVQVLQISHLQ